MEDLVINVVGFKKRVFHVILPLSHVVACLLEHSDSLFIRLTCYRDKFPVSKLLADNIGLVLHEFRKEVE